MGRPCLKPKCLEAAKNAAMVEGRGAYNPSQPAQQPASDPTADRWVNASGGITISKKHKKGIIQ